MNKKHVGSWWQRLGWRRRPARSAVDDFADMGTVFGLEASLAAADSVQGPDAVRVGDVAMSDIGTRRPTADRYARIGSDSVAQRLKGRSVR